MQRDLATRKLSVRPSVKRVDCDKMEVLPTFLNYMKEYSAYFLRGEMDGAWGRQLLREILGQADPVGAKTSIFSRYSLLAPQRQNLAKRSINTDIFL